MTEGPLTRSLANVMRLQHGEVEAEPRIISNAGVVMAYGARAISPVEQAYRRRLITHRQHYAAERIYTGYAIGIMGIRQAPAGINPSTPGGGLEAAAMAASDYRACRDHVGPRLWPAVFAYVIEEESAGSIAKRMGVNPTGMMALLSHALDVAADYFRLPVE
jgi:hypothetical protein